MKYIFLMIVLISLIFSTAAGAAASDPEYKTVEIKGTYGELLAVVRVDPTTDKIAYYLDIGPTAEEDQWQVPNPKELKILQSLYNPAATSAPSEE